MIPEFRTELFREMAARIPSLKLKMVDTCPNRPENYLWQTRAWFKGRTHPIQKAGFEVINKGDYTYQIAPFTFMDEVAPKATGAHFFIPEGRPNNVILFTDRKYHWRIRAVSGSGWVLAWHHRHGVQQVWLSPDLEKNPVIEFGKNWLTTLIASPNCGQFVVEGIDRPEYMESAEKLISPWTYGVLGTPLYKFWEAYDRLTNYNERSPLRNSGR